ncbi:MAG: FkbM family methyltransferase [Bdellovibrionales bacterium]|nr:FkbM family methyltransferase [Bdellovibrionales bacterium]
MAIWRWAIDVLFKGVPVFPPNTTLIGKLLRLPLVLVPPKLRVRVLSGPLAGYRWIAGSGNHGLWLGIYEREKQVEFSRVLERMPKDGVVFDCGANVGYYSLIAGRKIPGGTAHAFEPFPACVAFIQKHVEMNGVSNVKIHPVAVSNLSGDVFFERGVSNATGRLSSSGTLPVRQIKIDAEIEAGRLPVPHLIKMDIEGAELLALQGARETLMIHHPILFLATHGAQVHLECLSFLKGLGYEFESLDSLTVEMTNELKCCHPSTLTRAAQTSE